MDQLAALSGVSKSMIGQIERAETNTSISTLWKIASGLHIPFTSLIEHDRESVTLVSKETVDMVRSEDDLFRIYPYFPINGNQSFEILYIQQLGASRCRHAGISDCIRQCVGIVRRHSEV